MENEPFRTGYPVTTATHHPPHKKTATSLRSFPNSPLCDTAARWVHLMVSTESLWRNGI